MTLQKHKVDNMSESDAHMVMSWLTDAIESLEDEKDIQKADTAIPANEDSTTIAQSTVADAANGGLIPPSSDTHPVGQTAAAQSQLPIQASADAEKDKSKTNLPPELGRREKGETVAMPFLRRKALKDPKTDDFKKADSEASRLHAWAVVDRAAGLLSDERAGDSYIRKSFNVPEDLPVDQVTYGTLLYKLLVDPQRPSSDWWDSCVDFAKTIEGVTEPGAFAALLYYSPADFKIMDFIEKEEVSSSVENIKVHTYDTKNFDICPGAISAFESILECSCVGSEGLIVKAAKETDRFLGMEKKYLDKGKADVNEIEEMVRSIATTHYLVGQLSNQLERDFTDEFTFTSMHVGAVLPILEKGMDLDTLEKDGSLPFGATKVSPNQILTYGDGPAGTGESTSTIGKAHHEVEKVDDLIYTEDEKGTPEQEEAQRQANAQFDAEQRRLKDAAAARDAALTPGGASVSREDATAAAALLLSELEKATDDGRGAKETLAKVINYSEKLISMLGDNDDLDHWVNDKISRVGTYISDVTHHLEDQENLEIVEHRKDLESPSEIGPMARAAKRPNVIMREEFTTDEETEYKRQPDTSGAGPAGDTGEPDNVSGDAIEGLGMSADDHDHHHEDIGKT